MHNEFLTNICLLHLNIFTAVVYDVKLSLHEVRIIGYCRPVIQMLCFFSWNNQQYLIISLNAMSFWETSAKLFHSIFLCLIRYSFRRTE